MLVEVLLWGGLTYHTFSRSTMHAIETGLSPKTLYREIVAALAFHMYSHTQYPTSKEYNQVRLLQKCPVLKNTIGIFKSIRNASCDLGVKRMGHLTMRFVITL